MLVQESKIIRDTIQVLPGKRFKGETTPGGEELWNIGPPAGKQWTVIVNIEILEGPAPPE